MKRYQVIEFTPCGPPIAVSAPLPLTDAQLTADNLRAAARLSRDPARPNYTIEEVTPHG